MRSIFSIWSGPIRSDQMMRSGQNRDQIEQAIRQSSIEFRTKPTKAWSERRIKKFDQQISTRNAINIFDLIRSDQIRSNDQVRSEQRSDRTGNSTKFDRISNQADQSMIGKMEQEIWSRKEICTKRDHDQKGRSTNVIKKFDQQLRSRNLIKKFDQEIWSRKSIRHFDQDFWSESNFDRTSIQPWSIFGRSLIEFPSKYDRISVETLMKLEAI